MKHRTTTAITLIAVSALAALTGCGGSSGSSSGTAAAASGSAVRGGDLVMLAVVATVVFGLLMRLLIAALS